MKTMEARSVTHGTFTIERSYPYKPERVFDAFADPVKKRRWFADCKGLEAESYEIDFQVGGQERSRFRGTEGPMKGETFTNETTYQDIVTNKRIVFAYTMATGGTRFSASLATVEFIATDEGTLLIVTEQGAYFEGADGAQMREVGWRSLLDQLGKEFER